METEIWKDIKGYEGLYQVSNLGEIKSLKRYIKRKSGDYLVKEKILNKNLRNGYLSVCLCINKNHKYKNIHRLVAQAFILNLENKSQVNHINGIKTDNRVENLEWCTSSENTQHCYKQLGYKNVLQTNHPRNIKINQYDSYGNLIKTWKNIKSIEKELGITYYAIKLCCNGKNKTCGMFNYKFFELK